MNAIGKIDHGLIASRLIQQPMELLQKSLLLLGIGLTRHTSCLFVAKTKAVQQIDHALGGVVNPPAPVSYTHLDVYKRQRQYRAGNFPEPLSGYGVDHRHHGVHHQLAQKCLWRGYQPGDGRRNRRGQALTGTFIKKLFTPSCNIGLLWEVLIHYGTTEKLPWTIRFAV